MAKSTPNQLCTELGDGVILIKDPDGGEPISMELLSYRPRHARFDSVSVESGAAQSAAQRLGLWPNLTAAERLKWSGLIISNLRDRLTTWHHTDPAKAAAYRNP